MMLVSLLGWNPLIRKFTCILLALSMNIQVNSIYNGVLPSSVPLVSLFSLPPVPPPYSHFPPLPTTPPIEFFIIALALASLKNDSHLPPEPQLLPFELFHIHHKAACGNQSSPTKHS